MTSDILGIGEVSLSLMFQLRRADEPQKGETAVRVCFLVLSAGRDRYSLASRGALLKRIAASWGHLCLSFFFQFQDNKVS